MGKKKSIEKFFDKLCDKGSSLVIIAFGALGMWAAVCHQKSFSLDDLVIFCFSAYIVLIGQATLLRWRKRPWLIALMGLLIAPLLWFTAMRLPLVSARFPFFIGLISWIALFIDVPWCMLLLLWSARRALHLFRDMKYNERYLYTGKGDELCWRDITELTLMDSMPFIIIRLRNTPAYIEGINNPLRRMMMRIVYKVTGACFVINTTRYDGTPKQLLAKLNDLWEKHRRYNDFNVVV